MAWRPQLAITSIEWLGAHRYAILGTEVLIPQQDGLQSVPYFQRVDREDGEEWNSFVTRAAAETIAYLRLFKQRLEAEGDVYINLTWVTEAEFEELKAKQFTAARPLARFLGPFFRRGISR
jgi:hypothetical protein